MSTLPITVVIAARNAADTLPDALDSLLAQTHPASEILIMHNGCEDDTPSIAATYAERHPTISAHTTPADHGVGGAAQRGCQLATQPLLARLDADDTCNPERLAAQHQLLVRHNADLITSHIVITHSLGRGIQRYADWVNSLHQPAAFRQQRFIESPIVQPGVLMTREIYHQSGGYYRPDQRQGPEDYDLWLRIIAQQARIYQCPDARLNWRDSPHRLTRSHADYGKNPMAATKARHLAIVQQQHPQQLPFLIAGTGPQGRRLTRELLAAGATISHTFDIDPKRIGSTLHGIPIHAPAEIGRQRGHGILLGCVGHHGRHHISRQAMQCGYQIGHDYFPCC